MSEIRTLIDNWQELDDARLAANRAAKDATTKAEQAKQQLIAALESDNLTGAGGSHCLVEVVPKVVPTAGDWQEIYSYIAENGAWDLLQKRLGSKAVGLRWEDGIDIPGIVRTEIPNLRRKKLT